VQINNKLLTGTTTICDIVVHWGQALARGYFGAHIATATVVAQQPQQHWRLPRCRQTVGFTMS